MSALRLLKILHTVGRYRLDTLVTDTGATKRSIWLKLVATCYPKNDAPRGLRLRLALEELGPIFVKFGQLLSTRPDLVPHDIAEELNHLQDRVKPFDTQIFTRVVESALGDSVYNIFARFDDQPLASASVAQVHTATLHSGEEVIVKVIRPGIETTIDHDLALLKIFARFVEAVHRDGKRLRPVAVVEDYRTTILDELNLSLEAANASQLRRNFEGSPLLYVPQVFWEYSRRNVMVMERINGIQVSDLVALRAQNTHLKLLAERGVEIFFTQVFEHNFFHADMHPGNVFVARTTPETPSYIAVDMAIMGSLTREDQYYLARNLLAMFRRDYRQVAELHISSGWVPKATSLAGFEAAIRAVCEPIFEKPLKDISFGEALITLFQTAQRFDMPVQPQLVLLQKTLLNIEGLGRQLYPELNLWETAHPYLERWIKQRYHPRRLWREFRRDAPEWLEKLPQLPHLALESLDALQRVGQLEQTLQSQALAQAKQRREQRWRRLGASAGSVAAALVLSWQSLPQLSSESLLLLVLALALMLF